jgi:16S rRNA (cytosine1407-C5)-methyltransferase
MTEPNVLLPPEILAAIARYRPYLSPSDYQELLAAAAISAPSAVRVNLLKSSDPNADLEAWSERYNWQTAPIPFSTCSRQVLSSQTAPGQTLEHRLGYYYVQDAASILPVSLFSTSITPKLVLDMAASPGGKTTQLVDHNLDRDFVIANDSSNSRLSALRTVLQIWGSANTMISNFAGERLGDWFPQTFDRILLDAPCSMESLRVSASHPPRPITVDERSRLASRQLALLTSASKALKPGGELVYSTCTLAPEEDEAVVNALLDLAPNAFTIDRIPFGIPQASGLTKFQDQVFHSTLENSWRVWPQVFETNGFFAVRLTKIAGFSSDPAQPPARPFSATGFTQVSPKQSAMLNSQILDLYGISLIPQLTQNGLILYQRGDSLHLIPKAYIDNFQALPFHSLGMPFGKVFHGELALSVDLINRFGDLFTANVWTIPADKVAQWLSGQDLRNLDFQGLRMGSVAIVRDELGRNLGAGKLSANRLRNLLPNRNLLM